MQIYLFEPYLKSVIWGGEKITRLKGLDTAQQCVGESWELSAVPGHESVVSNGDERGANLTQLIERHGAKLVGTSVYDRYGSTFPLLIKIIDAKRDLSVQVHPDDELARKRHNSLGKTEMWYIMDAEPDAKIYSGLATLITPDEYTRLVSDHRIMDVVAKHDSHPGDVYYLPAGRIHAIGGGNLLAEIQETSDITYRVYDYDRRDADGKPRELHTELAKDAIDYTVYPHYEGFDGPLAPGAIVQCQYFNTYKLDLDGSAQIATSPESFTIVMCLDGECSLAVPGCDDVTLATAQTALVPASAPSLTITGRATLLYVQSPVTSDE